MSSRLLTADELARKLNISARTVRRLREAGEIPSVCISLPTAKAKHYRYSLEAVMQKLEKNWVDVAFKKGDKKK